MAMEQQYLEETVVQSNSFAEDDFCLETPKFVSNGDGFDCNICLDPVQDPVVTLCGHLFCWPCIYRWLHDGDVSAAEQCRRQWRHCPVCKAEVSRSSLVPLYGKFQTTNPSKAKASHLGLAIPRRPPGPACGAEAPSSLPPQLHHQNYPPTQNYVTSSMLDPSSSMANIFHPTIGMFGEAIYGRTFGNTMMNQYGYPNSYGHVGSSSPRLRRHIMQADESLSRICFFLFCCLVLCLLLF